MICSLQRGGLVPVRRSCKPEPQGRVGTRRRSEKNDSSKVFALSHQGHLADLEESYGTGFTLIEGLRIVLNAATKMSPWTAVALHVPPFGGLRGLVLSLRLGRQNHPVIGGLPREFAEAIHP